MIEVPDTFLKLYNSLVLTAILISQVLFMAMAIYHDGKTRKAAKLREQQEKAKAEYTLHDNP